MQIDRLFGILYLLLERKATTAQQLADHFQVSKRTILRDIDVLCAARIPICTMQGKGGGISLMEGFVLQKATLTESEQNQILLALQSLSATKHLRADEIVTKLGALFQPSRTDWIEVDFSRWGQSSSDTAKFELLKQSILATTAIQFDYISAKGEASLRRVYPVKLVFKGKAWYLQGFCLDRQAFRIFKLNRMLQTEKTRESFEAEKYKAPPIEETQTPILSLVELALVFAAPAAHRVYDEFDENAIHRADDGSVYVSACLPEDGWLYSFLLSFGKDVSILKPEHIRKKLSHMGSIL